jgi:hypothetical protein
MAQYRINNTCGHAYTYHLTGAERDRPRKAQWLTTQPCPRCRNSQTATRGCGHYTPSQGCPLHGETCR